MIPFYELRPEHIEVIHNHRELQFRPHIHDEIELVYVFEHGQHINISGKEYEIMQGEAAVIFPEIIHTYHRPVWRDTRAVFVICSPQLFGGRFPDLHYSVPKNPVITNVDPAVKMAFSEIATCSDFIEQAAWAMIIMIKLYKNLELIPITTDPIEDLSRKVMDFIAANFREDITVERLTKEFSVSKYYISRIFSARIKMSLPKYLSKLRSDYAAHLLRTTRKSITDIYSISGFGSQCTFNRSFLENYGITPSEYRHMRNSNKKDIQKKDDSTMLTKNNKTDTK